MKITLPILAAIFLVACSNDGEETLNVSNEQLLGKWNYETQYTTWNGTGTTFDPIPFIDNQASCEKDYIWFDNTVHCSRRDYYNDVCDFTEDAGSWSINGNKLTISGLDVYTVKAISDTLLKIKSGTDDTFLGQAVTYTFSKAE